MRLYLFPGYISIESARTNSPRLFHFLETERGVNLEAHSWDGTLSSLPTKPAIIRASSMMKCVSADLARQCAALGHFCFYDDQFILPNGEYVGGNRPIEEAEKFLDAHKDEPDVTREQTIAYLRSIAADRSTRGETVHITKQAQMLLDLFGKHVLCKDVVPSPVISGEYREVRVSILEHSSTWGSEGDVVGLDVKGVQEITRQLCEDAEKVSGLPYDHPISQAYFRKLAEGLESNLLNLKVAYHATETSYMLMSVFPPNVDLVQSAFRDRHSQWGGVAFLRQLMNAMLPPLIERLVVIGYPKSSKIIEWNYETARCD